MATATEYPDLIPPLLAALALDPDVLALVKGGAVDAGVATEVRIYGEKLRSYQPILSTAAANKPAPALVVASAGGGSSADQPPIAEPRLELAAYAPDWTQARQLWWKALAAVGNKTFRIGTSYFDVSAAGAAPHVDDEPVTGFPLATGFVSLVGMVVA